MKFTEDQINRVGSRFQYTPGCWLWSGRLCHRGYGQISLFDKTMRAHRVAYEIYVGDIPKGLYVCHRCDNPRCINPDHLFLGSAKDNAQDMIKKGRKPIIRGEKHASAKLTIDDVIAIKFMPGTQREVAEKFGIAQTTVSAIKNRYAWKHLELDSDDVGILLKCFERMDDRGRDCLLAMARCMPCMRGG